MSTTIAARPSEEVLHWLALALTPGLGAKKAVTLLERFGSPMRIFRASASELESCGLSGSVARSLASCCAFETAAEQQEKLLDAGVSLIPYNDGLYPPQLREIFDPPPMLFARGRLELLASVMVAMVGSRRASPYGAAVTAKLAAGLASAGVTVASGMARGIDTAAHVGALEAGGPTLAVFGCGLDIIYPAENRKLAERIASAGLLLSEFPLSTPAHPQNFPIRNRIISGLSQAVVVVEGVQYSGSLITARLALDQNRDVFAVPGNITSKLSFGPNLLIKQGAKLVQSASDILEELNPEIRRGLARQRELPLAEAAEGCSTPLNEMSRQILSFLKVDEPLHLDALLDHLLDCSSSEVIAALFELELRGKARQLPGRSYVKVWYE